jgi:hypothetical protein
VAVVVVAEVPMCLHLSPMGAKAGQEPSSIRGLAGLARMVGAAAAGLVVMGLADPVGPAGIRVRRKVLLEVEGEVFMSTRPCLAKGGMDFPWVNRERFRTKLMTRLTVGVQEAAEEVLVTEVVDFPARVIRAEVGAVGRAEVCLLVLHPYFLPPVGLAGFRG